MSADGGCTVPLFGDAGTGLCGWETEGRTPWCAAHRKRMRLHGDARAGIPVRRLPSRRPDAVAARVAAVAFAPSAYRGGRLGLA